MDIVKQIENEQLRDGLPSFDPGDTLRVNVRIREGEKERIQAFEGVCIARQGGGASETFTVRKVSPGSAWSGCSRCTRPCWSPSRWCAGAGFAGPSCTTCGAARARRPGSGSGSSAEPRAVVRTRGRGTRSGVGARR
jgi:hypothetical protein